MEKQLIFNHFELFLWEFEGLFYKVKILSFHNYCYLSESNYTFFSN